MIHKKCLFYFIILLLSGLNVKAQVWEVGLHGGGAGYIGDLNPDDPLKISGFLVGGFAKANLDPYWALGLHYNYGVIKGNDAKSDNAYFKERNLKFYTLLNELSLQLDFNFLKYFAGGGTKNFTPYIFTGIGGVFFNPKNEKGGVDLPLYRTEGQSSPYKNYALTIPYGMGIKFKVKNNWGLLTQIGYRTVLTDYLDDVSGTYKNMADWDAARENLADPSSSKIGVPGRQRGDFRKRDTYMFVSIGISYTFVSQKCYSF